jgi:hypothetical protein
MAPLAPTISVSVLRPEFALSQYGSELNLIGCGAGGVPSNVTLPFTLPVVAGSIGVAAAAGVLELAGAAL